MPTCNFVYCGNGIMSVKNISNAQLAIATQAHARRSRFFWLLSAGVRVRGVVANHPIAVAVAVDDGVIRRHRGRG